MTNKYNSMGGLSAEYIEGQLNEYDKKECIAMIEAKQIAYVRPVCIAIATIANAISELANSTENELESKYKFMKKHCPYMADDEIAKFIISGSK